MPLIRIPAPFDHPHWIFELKHDGYRALAFVEEGRCSLVSRRGNTLASWSQLGDEVARTLHAKQAVLDGEFVVLLPDGRSDFGALFSRREVPYFYAFDLLVLEGEDVLGQPLVERKGRLREIVPASSTSRLRYVHAVKAQGSELLSAGVRGGQRGDRGEVRGALPRRRKDDELAQGRESDYTKLEGRFEHVTKGKGSGTSRSSRHQYRLDPAVAAEAPRAVFF